LGLYKTLLTSFISTLCMAGAAHAQDKVKVVAASESWAQLLYLDQKNVPRGVIADFVHRMNEVQDKFQFEFIIYPRLRVDLVFIDKQADVYPFRTVAWTRPELNLLPTRTILSSGDVYFAKKANPFGGHKVFDDLKTKSIAGVRGYHYGIFNNNPDEDYVKKNFNAYLVGSNEAVVTYVLAGRADVGIVPEVIMAKYLEDPKMRERLIVADEFDSRVELSNLVRRDGPISVAEMNAIVDLLVKSGDVDRLKAKLSIPHRQPAKK
jgi:ABC-type amino acid transport substrate-binding protein